MNGLWTPQSAAITDPPMPQPAALWPSPRNVLRQQLSISSSDVLPDTNCYSFTDPGGMEGWVGLVGWLIADASPTKWLHGQLSVKRRIGKARRQNRRSNHYATPPTNDSLYSCYGMLEIVGTITIIIIFPIDTKVANLATSRMEFGKQHDTTDTMDFCPCQLVRDLLWTCYGEVAN